MQLLLCDRNDEQLLKNLRGKKVFVMTCNTCASICGVGGTHIAGAVSDNLSSRGIEVVGTASVKACCIHHMVDGCKELEKSSCDIILALMCSAGARVLQGKFGEKILNPMRTYGPGFTNADGSPVLMESVNGGEMTLAELAERDGLVVRAFFNK